MKNEVGIVLNRLVYGFTFAFLYQIVVGIATSLLSLPLTGNVQDLISGLEQINDGQGYLFIFWWIISTIIITGISLLIIRYKKYISPYKQEKDMDIPPKITPLTAIIIGAIISFLFFLLDLVIGSIQISSATDIQAIYEAANNGNFGPLGISIVFSIIAGFIIVGVASKTSKVKEITREYDFTILSEFSKFVTKKDSTITTSSDTAGLHPGALVHVGEKHVKEISFRQIEYDEKNYSSKEFEKIEDCLTTYNNPFVSWTNVVGIHDPDIVKKIGDYYKLHALTQSDIMNTELRPKIENHGEHLFLILKLPHILEDGKLFMEQISLIIGKNFVVSFQETKDDVFDPIRERIEKSVGVIRSRGSDYLTYTLVDAIIDHFFIIMENIGIQSEKLEEELMENPSPKTLQTIQLLKRHMIILRKAIWPLREVIDNFERMESELVEKKTRRYIRDVYSHTVQVMDNIEGLRDMIGGMLDTYLSSVSNKMNEVMKTLTIIASIFIPITFIAGIYGTNFQYIPELEWEGSYFVMLFVMAIIVFLMMMWFRKKHWL